ncbi:PKD domain-containing protein [Actinoplanes sp. NPDC049681]|uniref:PKD domain-containing protein n=1 Tax=Actinoplanes sp. NPDC049681 TaxID=3363905 RepID=UPI0037AE77A9
MKKTLARLPVAVGAAVAVVASLAGTAAATVVTPAAPRAGKLVQVGPIAEHGFPAWYRDSNNVRLEACVTLDDPLCPALPDTVPNPDAPVSYPDNFPDEFFYQLAGVDMTLNNGVRATIGMDLEGAWAAGEVREGDQMVFGRVRIRFDAPAGERYRIVHPYGIDDIVAGDKGVNMTEDVGITPGAFGGALNSRIGPFLKWDPAVAPAAPAGYIGDPGVDHKVVGSPYNTNFVRIERLDPLTGAVISQVGFTDLFSIQGRYATNAGVDIDQATYSLGSDGTGVVEVFATSEPDKVIEVVGNPALGFRGTRLRGANGHYYGRFPVTGPIPAGTKIEVVNASDQPATHKTRALVDVVRVDDVDYDADAQTLSVDASSSDRSARPQLTVTGFGPLGNSPFSGVVAPPATITVTSSAGGSATMNLISTGRTFRPGAPVAAATADTPAIIGQTVRLDGRASAGEIDTYRWTQTAGPQVTLADPAAALTTFVPTVPGDYTFSLAVTGPGGAAIPVSITVTVTQAAVPTAAAGADQTVVRGRAVTLDGSGSAAVESYSWRQVSGPAVTLSGATTARPTFTYPVQALPAVPGPNAAYVYDNDPVVLELTVRNPAGIAVDQVVVRPQPETLSGITVRYRTGSNEWRISGTSDLIAGQRFAAVLGSNLNGRVIGTPQVVDAAGAFSLRVTGPSPGTVRTVMLVTSTGARQLVNVTVTN